MSANGWYQVLSEPSNFDPELLIEDISKTGIKLTSYDPRIVSPDAPESCGIIFLSDIGAHVYNFLYHSSSCGRHHLIAVVDSVELTSGQIWSVVEAGASDVIDLSKTTAGECVEKIASRLRHWQRVKSMIESPRVSANLIGQSHTWRCALRQIVDAALDPNLSVLITGESGTGKELTAQLIHSIDNQRKDRRFVVLDCTTIVPELSGSEFFGHERGSFTGAVGRRDGAFALADGGTLFLDEVGELPILLQAELLRVIQEKRYKPVGGNVWKTTDFRLVCATNRDLHEQVRDGRFRSDLFHRIATWTCTLPPLRDRSEDILPLAQHFLAQTETHQEPPEFDATVAEYLVRRDYPGNVRELYQLVRRIACKSAGAGLITCGDIPEADRPASNGTAATWIDNGFQEAIRRAVSKGADLDEIRDTAESIAEVIALQQAGKDGTRNGAVARAAKMLNINRRTLEMHIKNRSERMRSLSH
jgi:transcriptional regulator with GAF, ATPase, and Fis domain